MPGKIIILALIIGSTVCKGQSDSLITRALNYYGIKVSYNSSLIYPGMSTGGEFLIKTRGVPDLKSRPQGHLKIINQLITLNFNWYHHPGFHDNFYLTTEWVRRKVKHTGFVSEFSTGPGYSRTFLAGTTYTVNENGDISIIKHAGYNYAVITVGGGFGYDFSLKRHIPVCVFSKMNILAMFPYNSTLYLRPVLQLGVRYSPGRADIRIGGGSISKSKEK